MIWITCTHSGRRKYKNNTNKLCAVIWKYFRNYPLRDRNQHRTSIFARLFISAYPLLSAFFLQSMGPQRSPCTPPPHDPPWVVSNCSVDPQEWFKRCCHLNINILVSTHIFWQKPFILFHFVKWLLACVQRPNDHHIVFGSNHIGRDNS